MKVEELVKWTVIGGIAYIAYQALQGVKQFGAGASDMGNQLSELGDTSADPTGATLAKWYDPRTRNVFMYWLTFPDGSHHIVWPSDVAADGTFTYSDGGGYRIGVDIAGGLRAYFS